MMTFLGMHSGKEKKEPGLTGAKAGQNVFLPMSIPIVALVRLLALAFMGWLLVF